MIFVVGGDPEIAWARDSDRHSFADVDKMVSLFPEMKGYSLVTVFGVGYPADNSEAHKFHSTFKDKDELFAIL